MRFVQLAGMDGRLDRSNKELNIKLQEYINYLREVEVALRGFMNDDPIIEVNFNQEYIERLIDEITNLIKKHI